MDLWNIILGILTVAGMFSGGGWLLSRDISGILDKQRIEMKNDMILLEERLTKKIESDMNHLEKNLTQKIEASR